MKKFRSTSMPAAALMIDDWLKLGGNLYRVTGVQSNDYGTWIIRMKPAHKKSTFKKPVRTLTLSVPKNTKFKVYNQK